MRRKVNVWGLILKDTVESEVFNRRKFVTPFPVEEIMSSEAQSF